MKKQSEYEAKMKLLEELIFQSISLSEEDLSDLLSSLVDILKKVIRFGALTSNKIAMKQLEDVIDEIRITENDSKNI